LEASDGEEAIAIFNGRSDIDLLLTDVQMPGSLDGIELARRVRMQAADLKVIVVSGHLEASKADGLAHAFVPKPYGLAAMVEKVKELLKPI
jgi:CheY-like chemotaxis protein